MTDTREAKVREQFNAWCTIKVSDAAKAPRAAALVQAYWNAWQAAYSAGREDGIEEIVERIEREDSDVSHPAHATLRYLVREVRSLSSKKDLEVNNGKV